MANKTARVLHLAPHFGGGVGTVVRALICQAPPNKPKFTFTHTLASLESASTATQAWANQQGIGLLDNLFQQPEHLAALLASHDIIHLHWWHHPLLNDFMHNDTWPAFRCVLWTHVNGHYPPQNFPIGLANYANLTVLATPWSLKTPALHDADHSKIRIIRSIAPVIQVPPRLPRSHGPIRVGYVGTVDPIKMHPRFLRICERLADQPLQFLVAGGPKHALLQHLAQERGLSEKLDILGPIRNVLPFMSSLDLFAYPLNPYHYGTGEQVLWEAMSCGAIPIIFGTDNEAMLLEQFRSVIVCRTEDAYCEALEKHSHPQVIEQLRQHLHHEITTFPAMKEAALRQQWESTYQELLDQQPDYHMLGTIPYDKTVRGRHLLFASAQGTAFHAFYQQCIDGLHSQFSLTPDLIRGLIAKTRGTAYHYANFFHADPSLAMVTGVLDQLQDWQRKIWWH
jgi:glycosyltransferase involved in cell wall biosynthesis